MKFSPLKCVDQILGKMRLQLEGVSEALLAIICRVKKLHVTPELRRAKQKPPPQNQKKTKLQGSRENHYPYKLL